MWVVNERQRMIFGFECVGCPARGPLPANKDNLTLVLRAVLEIARDLLRGPQWVVSGRRVEVLDPVIALDMRPSSGRWRERAVRPTPPKSSHLCSR
jgi:hypothetical protein